LFRFLTEEDKILSADEENSISEMYYEFNLELEDYFWNRRLEWDLIETKLYIFKLGSSQKIIGIPSGFYVMVGDVLGAVDWILVDEFVGRDLDVLIVKDGFNSWTLEKLELVDEEDGYEFYYPLTKNIIPVAPLNGSQCVLLSKSDRHKDTKDKTVDSFVAI